MMRRLRWWLEYALISLFLALARMLGPAGASRLGAAVAGAVGPLLPVSRIGLRNLELAFPEHDAAWRSATLRACWRNLGATMMELPWVRHLRPTEAGPGFEITGGENLPEPGQRAIAVSGHIANWELLPHAALHRGLHMAGLYRAPDNPLVDAALRRMRGGEAGMPLFPKGAKGARMAHRHLAQGGFLGLLQDQKLNEGLSLPFLGQEAMTAPALAAWALRFRCPVIPVRVQRLGPCRFRIVVDPPLPLPESGDAEADLRSLTQAVNDRLSGWIRQRPAEWLWLHRRFPREVYRRG